MRLRVSALLAVAVLLAGPVAAVHARTSSGRAKTPEQLVALALAAATGAKTVHVVASGIDDNGQPLSFDLRLVAGKGGGGTLSLGKLTFDMVRVGTKAYFKGGADFWRQFGGGVAVQLLQGRWLMASATKGDLASFTPLTDIGKLFTEILSSHGALKRGGTKTINGQPAIGIVDTSSGGGTLWIAAKGTAYPLELTQTGGKGDIVFESWNKRVKLKAPKDAIDFDKLKK